MGARKFKPFAARQETTYFSSKQSLPPKKSDIYFAVRSDGSIVKQFTVTAPSGETGTVVEILDTQKRSEILLEPFTRSMLTIELTDEMIVENWALNHPGCPASESEAARSATDAGEVAGTAVRRVEQKRPEMDTQILMAPSLDCFPLRKVVQFKGGSHNETVTVSIDLGEPPDKSFEIPDGFKERSPAELETAYQAKFPGHEFWAKRMMDTAETRYRRHHR